MVDLVVRGKCPSCGTDLSMENLSEGLCPVCLLELGLESETELATALYPESSTEAGETFTPGELLGDRYRIESLLGRGGMGEVWRAYDLKLRLEVALKSLHPKLFDTPEGLELLRDEVRAAREVTSPNVCRLYDLVEVGDRELVSMEYVDGVTLLEHLREAGPLDLKEANEIASQLLAGLEAIHRAGLVHRDIKPENVMLTRTGRVVVMDFGLTSPSGTGSMAGTPAYMAPEQAKGQAVDARADVFSAGMVLAEMLSAQAGPDQSSRQTFWKAVREQPPVVSESPWKGILQQALDPETGQRFASAQELARALEEVAFRVEGTEHKHPYPGLASFQEEDAEFFFGREAEVEAVWKKLQQAHLLGLIGPSGSGKSSFLNAGLLPAKPSGWSCVRMNPGGAPHAALGRALLPELEGDSQAMEALVALEDLDSALTALRRWQIKHEQVLLIVDQFEELFTQTSEDAQQRFAELLGRAAFDADIHVLLSMRDDFLLRCHDFETLTPVFSELTPLKPPMGASLRRAVVQPALRCGYRFEDDSIVEAMLEEVTRERGALPLIAFTAAQLWEQRDQETGYLTIEAYEAIGGVGGALAQHAEQTLEKIGQDGIPIVRELFRNLVTAQGTRAARDREELLSVFEATKRETAAPVLDTLIDARLLTSYEVQNGDEAPHHRIEIVHESLLSAWPRLVRWQTQDQEGAQLRDELRNQAELWDQHDRSADYLWTGTAYREYQLWRERYPGGLTTVEEEFARAMTTHAERRKRRRRIALAAVFIVLLAVLAIIGGLWRQSEAAKKEAIAEARRAEAAKLLALAQLQLEEDPTEALAYTIASLELADTEEARVSVMRALWAGPPVLVLDSEAFVHHRVPRFSPDGRWLSVAGQAWSTVLVWHHDGSGPVVLGGHPVSTSWEIHTGWTSENELVTGHWTEGRVRIWSFPGGELVREIDLGGPAWWRVGAGHLFAEVLPTGSNSDVGIYDLRSWELLDGEPEDLGQVDLVAGLGGWCSMLYPDGPGWIYLKGNHIFYRPLPVRQDVPDRLVGSHENEVGCLGIPPELNRVWTRDAVTSELRLWDLSGSTGEPLRVVAPPSGVEPGTPVLPALDGRWLHDAVAIRDGKALVWDRRSLPLAKPRELKRSGSWFYSGLDFHPAGDWAVAATKRMSELSFWPLRVPLPAVVAGYDTQAFRPVAFTPDGKWLATIWPDRSLRLWPLPGNESQTVRVLHEGEMPSIVGTLTIDPAGEQLFLAGYGDLNFVVPLDGDEPKHLEGFSATTSTFQGAFSPSGRLAATGTLSTSEKKYFRVWDLETAEVEAFELPPPVAALESEDSSSSSTDYGVTVWSLAFTDETTLFTAGDTGVLRWDLEAGTYERMVSVKPGQAARFWPSGNRQQLITAVVDLSGECSPLLLHDLQADESRELKTFATCPDLVWGTDRQVVFDDTLTVMAIGRPDGSLWVGRVGGGAAHLLTGHQGPIAGLALSPDGRWIASSGEDKTLRLWPMPDLDKPPLHTLPREELIAKVKSLTNLRAVRDESSSTGWSIEIGPFPGWQEVPTW